METMWRLVSKLGEGLTYKNWGAKMFLKTFHEEKFHEKNLSRSGDIENFGTKDWKYAINYCEILLKSPLLQFYTLLVLTLFTYTIFFSRYSTIRF